MRLPAPSAEGAVPLLRPAPSSPAPLLPPHSFFPHSLPLSRMTHSRLLSQSTFPYLPLSLSQTLSSLPSSLNISRTPSLPLLSPLSPPQARFPFSLQLLIPLLFPISDSYHTHHSPTFPLVSHPASRTSHPAPSNQSVWWQISDSAEKRGTAQPVGSHFQVDASAVQEGAG